MSEPRPSQPGTDRNLLFGILALQLDFVSRDAIIEGMNAWVLDKRRSLGEILCERGALAAARRVLLDTLVEEHLQQHGDDARRSLAALGSRTTFRDELGQVTDPDVQTTLSEVGWDGPGRGTTLAPGDSRYRRLRPHARGGLGEVFVAEDSELHREVAVKEIQPERADDPGSRARFLLEAEVTGALEHPGIVPVYGLGVYPDGRPYYAMRFIRGDSLKEAIDQFHASTATGPDRERARRHLLRRFIDVCNAVAYAHSRGVVHRDLKPHNVMLGHFGETLVLDWGLAKVSVEAAGPARADAPTTDPLVRPSGSEHAGTRAGAVLGTPGYMSPEQAAGRLNEIGPASDVYSLGVTLYVLLTGRKPFDRTDPTDAPATPERYPSAREVRPDTPGALDAVCQKAMAVRPSDRYASPLDLAADVERWLADEPVAVYRDPWPVRAARWARRHRTGVAAGLVFLMSAVVALALGSALVWREQQQTLVQKREAEENYDMARDLSASGIELVAASEAQFAADPVKHAARKELLVAAARAFHKHVEASPDDPEVRRQAARVYRYAANVHRLEREHAAAESLYKDAVELLDSLAEQFPGEPAFRLQLTETLRDQAKVQSTLGRLGQADDALTRVIDTTRELRHTDADNPHYRRALAVALLNRASARYVRGRFAEAVADGGQAAELFDGLNQVPTHAHPYDGVLRGAALNVMAAAEREAGRPEKAGPLHQQAVGLLAELTKQDRPGLNRNDALDFRSSLLLEQCRTLKPKLKLRKQLESIMTSVAKQWELLADNNKAIPQYRESLGVAYYERGRLRAEDGRTDEARADFEKSREILEAEVRRSPDVPSLSADLGRTYAALGRLARTAGDGAGAREWSDKAVSALRSTIDRAPERALDRRDLAEVEAEQRR